MIRVNTNGIHEIDFNFDGTTTAAITSPGVVTVTHAGVATGITQLTGDVTAGPGSGSVAATVVKVNGAAVPASHAYVGTNGSSQIIAATTPLLPANNLSDVASTSTARTNLGLGTMATQNATAVAITGGTIEGTGITVGVGTASPQAPLHVAGSTNVMRFDNVGILNNPNLWITQNAYFDGTWHRITSGSPVAGFNWVQSSGLLSFVSDTSTTGTPNPVTIATLSETGAFTGKNLAITSGGGGSLTFQDGTTQSTAATSPTLQTNGTNNTVQNKLNLVAGSNVTLTADGSGDVTIASSGAGSGPSIVDYVTSTTAYTTNYTYTPATLASGTYRVSVNAHLSVSGTGGGSAFFTGVLSYTNKASVVQTVPLFDTTLPVVTNAQDVLTNPFVFCSNGSAVSLSFNVTTSPSGVVGTFTVSAIVIEQLGT